MSNIFYLVFWEIKESEQRQSSEEYVVNTTVLLQWFEWKWSQCRINLQLTQLILCLSLFCSRTHLLSMLARTYTHPWRASTELKLTLICSIAKELHYIKVIELLVPLTEGQVQLIGLVLGWTLVHIQIIHPSYLLSCQPSTWALPFGGFSSEKCLSASWVLL